MVTEIFNLTKTATGNQGKGAKQLMQLTSERNLKSMNRKGYRMMM